MYYNYGSVYIYIVFGYTHTNTHVRECAVLFDVYPCLHPFTCYSLFAPVETFCHVISVVTTSCVFVLFDSSSYTDPIFCTKIEVKVNVSFFRFLV